MIFHDFVVILECFFMLFGDFSRFLRSEGARGGSEGSRELKSMKNLCFSIGFIGFWWF